MAFRFALESVLRLRISYEQQEQSRLEMAAQHLYTAQKHCESLKKEKVSLEENFRKLMQSGAQPADLHYYLASKAGLEVVEIEAARALVDARKQWAEQRTKFLHARRDREVIASIRQRQHDQYVLEEGRREQQQIDDLFAMRRLQSNR
jgi:flagellar export protein FliJ